MKARPTTEFFLYYAFLLKNDLVDRAYEFRDSTTITLFAMWPETAEKFEWAINKARQPSTKFFGLHRKRGPQLDDGQRALVEDIWYDAGLLSDRSEADSIIQTDLAADPIPCWANIRMMKNGQGWQIRRIELVLQRDHPRPIAFNAEDQLSLLKCRQHGRAARSIFQDHSGRCVIRC